MPVWSVDIVAAKNEGGPAAFVAQNQPTAPSGQIFTDNGDAISWNNTTGHDHCISVLADPNMLPSSPRNPGFVIPAHQTPAFTVGNTGTAAVKIAYSCLIHPNETGTITVSPT